MIAPMVHVTLLARSEDRERLLTRLRDLGLVHLSAQQAGDEDLQGLREDLQTIDRVLHRLAPLAGGKTVIAADCPDHVEAVVDEVILCESRLKAIEGLQSHLLREHRVWEPFGELDGRCVFDLKRSGLSLGFFRNAPAELPPLPNDGIWLRGDSGHVLALCPGEIPKTDLVPIDMPIRSPRTLRTRCERLEEGHMLYENRLRTLTAALPLLLGKRDALEDRITLAGARATLQQGGGLCWIEGFLPAADVSAAEVFAAEQGLAVSIRDVGETDAVPTKLENGPLVNWVRPVMEFLGVTPGYQEVDVSMFFLVFLSVFSSMIIGDAGYGALLLGGVFVLTRVRPALRGPFANLLMLMGAGTVVWGLLSGNVFGMGGLPALKACTDGDSLMHLCFSLGAVHLSLAHGWSLWRRRREWKALAELGWIGLTWVMYATANTMVLGKEFPPIMLPVAVGSALLIPLFMTPWSKIKTDWVDHVMLPLSFVNNFVDVVSYVRLYAVGMATLALASSFNAMTLGGAEERGFLMTVLMVLILILGHALNFVLAGMGVMVHGIRLNTLEFASHLGMTWSGTPYQPFTNSNQKKSEPLTTGEEHG